MKKLRNLFVLLARLIALSFLVLAFAQPYIPIDKNNNQQSLESEKVQIYIDNSFSMEAVGENGPLLEEAKERAREIVRGYRGSDQINIRSNSSGGRRFLNPDDAIAAIDEIEISPAARSMSDVLMAQKFLAEQEGLINKNIFLLSDFQQDGKSEVKPITFLDSSYLLRTFPLKAVRDENLSVDSVWFKSPVLQINEPAELVVKISNRGKSDFSNGSASLIINGVKKSVIGFDVSAGSSAQLEMGFTENTGGWKSASIEIENPPLTFDDEYHMAFNVKAKVNVVIINDELESKHLQKLFRNDPYYSEVNQAVGSINLTEIKEADLLIFNELDNVSNGLIEAIKPVLKQGGSLLIIPSRKVVSNPLSKLTSELGIAPYADLVNQNTRVDKLDFDNPIFTDVFVGIPSNPNYPTARKYFKIQHSGSVGANPIMQLQNGGIFLNYSSYELGHIYQSAVPLDSAWSNFPNHGLFVPIVLQMAVNRIVRFPLSVTIGQNNVFKSVPEVTFEQGKVILKSADREWMPVIQITSNQSFIDAGNDLNSGVVSVLSGDSLLQQVAFNYSRSESGGNFNTKSELATLFQKASYSSFENASASVSNSIKEMRFGRTFWKWCVILTLIFLAIEILLLKFWSNRSASKN